MLGCTCLIMAGTSYRRWDSKGKSEGAKAKHVNVEKVRCEHRRSSSRKKGRVCSFLFHHFPLLLLLHRTFLVTYFIAPSKGRAPKRVPALCFCPHLYNLPSLLFLSHNYFNFSHFAHTSHPKWLQDGFPAPRPRGSSAPVCGGSKTSSASTCLSPDKPLSSHHGHSFACRQLPHSSRPASATSQTYVQQTFWDYPRDAITNTMIALLCQGL